MSETITDSLEPRSSTQGEEDAAAQARAAAFEHKTALWRKLLVLLVMSATAMSALVYPLRLTDAVLAQLDLWAAEAGYWGEFYSQQLRSQLTFSHSPTLLKEMVAQGYLLALLCGLLGLKVSVALSRGGARLAGDGWRRRLGALCANPQAWIIAVLAYMGISAFWLSPTIHFSMRTYLLFALGVVFFLTVLELASTPALQRRFMLLVCVCGAVVAGVALLQHTGSAGWFLPPFQDRNRVGSLIGHNTGVSSWLLFPLSFSLYFALLAHRRWQRGVAWGLLVGILCVLVAAQSRAVWLLVLLFFPLYFWIQFRAAQRVLRVRHALSALALLVAIVALQSVAPERNPFARRENSLAERVKGHVLNPDQLLRETRLRILVASLPLIAEKPILGHGLGSFQYVYPPAQGRYFRLHPDSRLGTTTKRTDLAHNDYLQLLVETGAVGALLLAVPLGIFLVRGWRGYRRVGNAGERAAANAVLFPMAAVSLHALVDFPMHLMPIALALAACLAFWASAGCSDSGREEQPVSLRQEGLRWKAVLLLASFVLAAGWTVRFAYPFVLREFVSDIYTSDGNNWLMSYHSLPRSEVAAQHDALHRGWQQFNRAVKLNPFNGQAYEGLVQSYLGRGNIDMLLLRKAQEHGDEQKAQAWRLGARRNYEAAVQFGYVQPNSGELRYHFTYYQIGVAYFMLARLEREVPGNEELSRRYLHAAKDALQQALATNPADTASMLELANLLEELPQPNVAEAARLRQQVFRLDPAFAANEYLGPVIAAAERGDFLSAHQLYRKVERLAAWDWRTKLTRAELYLREAVWPPAQFDGETTSPAAREWLALRLKTGSALLGEVEDEHGSDPAVRRLRMLYGAAQGRYGEALGIADEFVRRHPHDWDLVILRAQLAERAGQKREVPHWLSISPEGNRRTQRYRLFYFGQRALGARQLANLTPHVKLDIGEGLRAAAFLKATGEWEKVHMLAENLMQNHPGEAQVAKLWQEVRQRREGVSPR